MPTSNGRPPLYIDETLGQHFGESCRGDWQIAALQLTEHEGRGGNVADVNRAVDKTATEFARGSADLNLERDHIAARYQRAKHLERI